MVQGNGFIEGFIREVDELIRTAQGNLARKKLKALSINEIPPTNLWKIAALANRADWPEFAIQVLRPIVRPVKRVGPPPQDADFSEYGLALLRLGAVEEAVELLKKVNTKNSPDALFYLSLVRIKEWDYLPAISLIEEYLKTDLKPYARRVAQLNLAACHTHEGRLEEAFQNLQNLIQECEETPGLLLMKAHAIRLLGIAEIRRKRLQAALGYFLQAENLLAPVGGYEHFFARKWMAIAEFLICPSHQDGLLAIEREAIEKRHWETIRDLDFHRALALKDPAIIEKLYVGSPFPAFQERLRKTFPDVLIRDPYPLHLGGQGKDLVINIGEVESFEVPLKRGQTVHRLLLTLLSDHYRGFSAANLFGSLFPGEFFHLKVSEFRVHQAIKKLRRWFNQNHLPLQIERNKNNFRLSSSAPCTLLFNAKQKSKASVTNFRMEFLGNKFKGEFTAIEVAKLLGVTVRSANFYIKEGIAAGQIKRLNHGSKSRYRFSAP